MSPVAFRAVGFVTGITGLVCFLPALDRGPRRAQAAPAAAPAVVNTFLSDVDTFVFSDQANVNYGTEPDLRVGGIFQGDVNGNFRSLVRFPTLDGALPAGAVVDAAVLRLYHEGSPGSLVILARRVTAAWNEATVTWANQPGSAAPEASRAVGTGGGVYDWDVTAHVRAWVENGVPNHGFLLRAENESANAVKPFRSSDYTLRGTPQPSTVQLEVTWHREQTPTATRTVARLSPTPTVTGRTPTPEPRTATLTPTGRTPSPEPRTATPTVTPGGDFPTRTNTPEPTREGPTTTPMRLSPTPVVETREPPATRTPTPAEATPTSGGHVLTSTATPSPTPSPGVAVSPVYLPFVWHNLPAGGSPTPPPGYPTTVTPPTFPTTPGAPPRVSPSPTLATATPTATALAPGPVAELFTLREEHRIGCHINSWGYQSADLAACGEGFFLHQMAPLAAGTDFRPIPRAASKFVVADGLSPETGGVVDVAITFSAHVEAAKVDGPPAPVLVRALVDGLVASPGPVVFADSTMDQEFHAASFVFTTRSGPGIHTVVIEWSSPNTTARIRDASVLAVVDAAEVNGHHLAARSSPGTAAVAMTSAAWTAIPLASLPFVVPAGGETVATFAAGVEMQQGDFLMLRAVVDDGAFTAVPAEIALAGRSYHAGARAVSFHLPDLPAGPHTVRFEWRGSVTEVVALATVKGWTATVLSGPPLTDGTAFAVRSQTDTATALAGQGYQPIPGLSASIDREGFAEFAVTFSGAVTGRDPVYVAPTLNGQVLASQEVVVHWPVLVCPDPACQQPIIHDSGGRSFTFALKAIWPLDEPIEVGLALRASNFDDSFASVAQATLTVLRQPWLGPDLALGANMGGASRVREALIEPARGTRQLLLIVIDPQREGQPQADAAYMNGLEAVAFGADPSSAGHLRAMSGGRLEVVKAGPGILGPYLAAQPPAHYWSAHSCEDDTGLINDGFRSGWDELRVEALKSAEAAFDFAAYDANLDGVITSDELALAIVVPQNDPSGSDALPRFRPYCGDDGTFLTADGLEIRNLLHLYSKALGENLSDQLVSVNTLTHELGHLLMWLDDAYGGTALFVSGPSAGMLCNPSGQDQGDPNCRVRKVGTAPEGLSLMSTTFTATPHLDAFHKLHLGWATPKLVLQPGSYELADVKLGGEVLVLPRRNTPLKEYFLLESRFAAPLASDPGYDFGLEDRGLAIYHIIEPNAACHTGISPPAGCASYQPARCVAENVWDQYFSNFLRPGLRLIQPDGGHITTCTNDGQGGQSCETEFGETLWGTWLGESISDTGVWDCPAILGDPLPVGSAPLLLWSDGTASGYRLQNIRFGDGLSMKLEIEVDD